jgi:GTP-binding protein Era
MEKQQSKTMNENKNVNSAEETGAEIKSIDEILGGMTSPNVKEGHKAGFVNIVGNPNVGKSTLMNDLVGERVSIITSKAQTTRHRIMGIVNTPAYQIVFSDTPGVLKPKYKLQESMLEFSEGALTDADVLLYVTDVVEDPTKNADFLARVAKEDVPVLLVINKIDLLKGQDDLIAIVDRWKALLPKAEIFPTSALERFNTSNLMKRIVELLPVSAPYFGKDALTDKPARFFVTEIIREKILLNYDKEVPYSTEVIVEKFEEKPGSIHIMAVVYVERDSQKGILIGKGGSMLKRVGMESRKDIETFFGKRVFLELFVKVEPNWRNRENKLKAFGYVE